MPLGANGVDVAQQAALDPILGLPVLDVVMPLVADRQVEFLRVGHAGHFLALADRLGHELLGDHVQPLLHGRDGDGGVQVQRRGDDDRLDAVLLGVFQQLLVGPVDLHVLLGFRLGLPAIDRHQPGADRQQRRLVVLVRPIAVKGAELVEGADVGNGLDLDEFGIQGPDQARCLRRRCRSRRHGPANRSPSCSRSRIRPARRRPRRRQPHPP